MKEIIYYEANDGTRFDDEVECIEYEKHLGLSNLNMEIIFTDNSGNKLQYPINNFSQIFGIQITFPQEEDYQTLYKTFVQMIEDDIDDLPDWTQIVLREDNSIRIFYSDNLDQWICLDYYINNLIEESNEIFRELNEQNAY